MKIEWKSNDGAGRAKLVASFDGYDASPFLNELLVDGMPILVNADRLGVASVLAFGRYSSGSLELPLAVSPTVAQAVERFLSPTWVQVEPIEYEAKALPVGLGTLALAFDGLSKNESTNEWGMPRTMSFELRRSDIWSGSLASLDTYISGSNAWVFSGENPSNFHRVLPYLAWAVVFSESLQIDSIRLPSGCLLNVEEKAKLADLLESCRLGLVDEVLPERD